MMKHIKLMPLLEIKDNDILTAIKKYDFSEIDIEYEDYEPHEQTFEVTIPLPENKELIFDAYISYQYNEPVFKGSYTNPPDPDTLTINDVEIKDIGLWEDGNDIEYDFKVIKKELEKLINNIF